MDDIDTDKIDDAVLALLYLTLTSERGVEGGRAWKSFDWAAMDRLFEKGFIGDPKSKAKSVYVTPEGRAKAQELFEKMFRK